MSQPTHDSYRGDQPASPYTDRYPQDRAPVDGSPQGSYGVPPASQSTNPWAIAALVLSLCGTAVLAVVAGHVALSQIKRTGEQGKPLAIVGLVLGYVEVVVYLVLLAAMIGLIGWGMLQS